MSIPWINERQGNEEEKKEYNYDNENPMLLGGNGQDLLRQREINEPLLGGGGDRQQVQNNS